MTLRVVRSLLSLPAAMFYCLVVSGLHRGIPVSGGAAELAVVLASVLLPCSVALWLMADARGRHSRLPYDFDSLAFYAWPVLAPVYLFSTRGWRGFAPIGWFVMMWIVATGAVGILGRE